MIVISAFPIPIFLRVLYIFLVSAQLRLCLLGSRSYRLSLFSSRLKEAYQFCTVIVEVLLVTNPQRLDFFSVFGSSSLEPSAKRVPVMVKASRPLLSKVCGISTGAMLFLGSRDRFIPDFWTCACDFWLRDFVALWGVVNVENEMSHCLLGGLAYVSTPGYSLRALWRGIRSLRSFLAWI